MTINNVAAYNLIAPVPNCRELETAERLLLLHGMVQTQEALAAGKLASLLPCRDGKLIVTRGRLGEKSLQRLLGVSSLPILMPNSRVAYLYMVEAHTGGFGLVHRSVVSTLARSRKKVWVVRGRNLARKVVNSCPRCDLDRKETLLQQMANIKEEQLIFGFCGSLHSQGRGEQESKVEDLDTCLLLQSYSCSLFSCLSRLFHS